MPRIGTNEIVPLMLLSSLVLIKQRVLVSALAQHRTVWHDWIRHIRGIRVQIVRARHCVESSRPRTQRSRHQTEADSQLASLARMTGLATLARMTGLATLARMTGLATLARMTASRPRHQPGPELGDGPPRP